ncbi:11S globulin seed storage protein 2 [Capsicum baccatum]|uniref:11S globulin seed storage protein 2 n=2 Tax=Capsicum baccatum TaxID=33114 RepID=A0A2G2WU20_CAPBA|nr:11S globulin seed storage protein 2 [Capsicum baccatum]
MKLEEKVRAKEEETRQLQARKQEKKETEIKQLRRNLNFKATPMPAFYREPGRRLEKNKDGQSWEEAGARAAVRGRWRMDRKREILDVLRAKPVIFCVETRSNTPMPAFYREPGRRSEKNKDGQSWEEAGVRAAVRGRWRMDRKREILDVLRAKPVIFCVETRSNTPMPAFYREPGRRSEENKDGQSWEEAGARAAVRGRWRMDRKREILDVLRAKPVIFCVETRSNTPMPAFYREPGRRSEKNKDGQSWEEAGARAAVWRMDRKREILDVLRAKPVIFCVETSRAKATSATENTVRCLRAEVYNRCSTNGGRPGSYLLRRCRGGGDHFGPDLRALTPASLEGRFEPPTLAHHGFRSNYSSFSQTAAWLQLQQAKRPNKPNQIGGFTELWDENEEQFQCTGVAPMRNGLRRNSLSLPNFHPMPRLVYIERGRGLISIIFPGCAETFQTQSQTFQAGRDPWEESGQGRRSDQHQKVHRIRQGDVVAIPAGAAQD